MIMKRLMFIVIIILSCILITISCEKDENKLSNRELLMANSWIRQSMKENGVEILPGSNYVCHNDDVWIFWPDGTLTVDPGIIKCHEDDYVASGSWQLTADENTIMLLLDDEEWIFKIAVLTKNKLVLSIEGQGITSEITYVPLEN